MKILHLDLKCMKIVTTAFDLSIFCLFVCFKKNKNKSDRVKGRKICTELWGRAPLRITV